MFKENDIVVCTKSDDLVDPCIGCVGEVSRSNNLRFTFRVLGRGPCGVSEGSCEGLHTEEEWVKSGLFLHKIGRFYV